MRFAQQFRQFCPQCGCPDLLWSRVADALGSPAPQSVKDVFLDAAGFFGVDLGASGEPFLSAPVWWCRDCDNCGVVFAESGSVAGHV